MIQTVKLLKNAYFVNGYMTVPFDPENREYKMVQAWLAEGNEPLPADEPE